jgi:pimeloyl-ACP methyl ester carboxylesterase
MLLPFHLDSGEMNAAAALQAIGFEWLMQDDQPDVVRGAVGLFADSPIAYYQELPGVYPPNFIIVRDGGDWWFYSSGVNSLFHGVASVAGGVGELYSPGVLVHSFFYSAYNLYVKPHLDALVGTPGPGVKFHFCGHSYGGALAFLAGIDYKARYGGGRVEVLTFGQPRVFTRDFTDPGFRYTRLAFFLDPIAQLPPVTIGLNYGATVGLPVVPNIWTHFGTGKGIVLNGTISDFPNVVTVVDSYNLGVYSASGQWHRYDNYWQAIRAANSPSLFNTAPWTTFSNTVVNQQVPLDQLPNQAMPPNSAFLDPGKVNRVYFGGQNIVQPNQPMNFVILDPVFSAPSLNNGSVPQPISGGSGVADLYQIEVFYNAFGNTFRERYCCNATGALAALKFGVNDLDPFLTWRPPGTVIEYMKASLISNPRQGTTKILHGSKTNFATSNRKGVTQDCALVNMLFGGVKVAVRSFRCWQDDLITFDANGQPTNTAAAQGFLNTLATTLRTSPAWSSLGWIKKVNAPSPNYTPIVAVTNVNGQMADLQIDPNAFAPYTGMNAAKYLLIQGPRNRNLSGLYGKFAIIQAVSPNIRVRYQMIFGQPTWNQVGLIVRPYGPVEIGFDTIQFHDWRSHKTADPTVREVGRGRKALTRVG